MLDIKVDQARRLNVSSKAVLTVDIVGFSLRTVPEQFQTIQVLIQLLNHAIPEEHNCCSARIWSPAGDGGALTFWKSIPAAVETAFSLSKMVGEFNSRGFVDLSGRRWEKPVEKLYIRLGLHIGPIVKARDFDERENIWGNGINYSARVVNFAKPGQIVASEDFFRTHDWPEDVEVERIGTWWAKHHVQIVLYNVFSEARGVGIPFARAGKWAGPFQGPIEQAIETYTAMAKEGLRSGRAFRAVVLAKRLLDLKPDHDLVKEIVDSVSSEFSGSPRVNHALYDRFFSPLSSGALLYFLENSFFSYFEAGDVIFRKGDRAESFMVVVSGEIELFMNGSSRHEEVTFTKGSLIGEMGLFHHGQKRSATLIASSRVIVLSVKYSHFSLGSTEVELASREFLEEIREHIWVYYRRRAVENAISSDPLLGYLPAAEKKLLAGNGKLQFLPDHYHDTIDLDLKTLWNSWVIVVAGKLALSDGSQQEVAGYAGGESFGPLRLVVGGLPPFSGAEIISGTHLLRFDWQVISGLLKKHSAFSQACIEVGAQERVRLGLI